MGKEKKFSLPEVLINVFQKVYFRVLFFFFFFLLGGGGGGGGGVFGIYEFLKATGRGNLKYLKSTT